MLGRSCILNVEAGWSGQGDRYVLFKSAHDHSGSEDMEQRPPFRSETPASPETRLGHSSVIRVGRSRS